MPEDFGATWRSTVERDFQHRPKIIFAQLSPSADQGVRPCEIGEQAIYPERFLDDRYGVGKFLFAVCGVEPVHVYRAAKRSQQTRTTRDYPEAIIGIVLLNPIDALRICRPQCAQEIFRNLAALVLFYFPVFPAIQRDQLGIVVIW